MKQIKVSAARDLGLQFTENHHSMVGQDGAYSIPLPDGRSFWFFGDTLIGARVPGESLWFPGGHRLGPGDMSGHGLIRRMLTNTGLLLSNRDGSRGLTEFAYIEDANGDIRQLIPHAADEPRDEIRVWCLHGIAIGPRLYLYYITVTMEADGPMPVNFSLRGSGLAVSTIRDFRFHRIDGPDGLVWWPSHLPQFGSSVLHDSRNGCIYLYGVRKADDGTQCCCIARVMTPAIEDFEAYEYFVGDSHHWSRDPSRAATIMTGMPNEMSVSWNQHLGCFLAVHSLDLTGRIVARTAPNPWGPWSEPIDLWKVVPPTLDYSIPYTPLIYAAKEHPELSSDGGRSLYITYIEFEEYFPHLIEVILE